MKIAFITYWSINEGLSQATSILHLKVLNDFSQVEKIDYYTFEKEEIIQIPTIASKINHFSLKRGLGSSLINKIKDYHGAWKIIHSNHKAIKYDLVIARSSFAGIFALFIKLIYGIPFVVESFEPHSEYQVNIPNGWSKWGIRYLFLNFFETREKNISSVLLTVSNFYKKKLIEQGVPENKIIVQPCCVDYAKVKFCSITRRSIRNQFNIPDANLVGIYVGKFGGLYYEKEAFKLIKDLSEILKHKFSIILLTPSDREYLIEQLTSIGLAKKNINVLFVKPEEVFDYLIASDFAFNFHISNNVSNFFSPIKNAEYWSVGLPIVIPTRIGDDSEIVEKLNVGIVHDFSRKINEDQVNKLLEIINSVNYRSTVINKTIKYRSLDLIHNTYSEMFRNLKVK
jgi:glycosyltransferase involved in cell wall biosynthesis